MCGNLARTPQQASALLATLKRDGWQHWGEHYIEGFQTFWAGLEKPAQLPQTCGGCRGGCGNPDCEIRRCARERNVEVCSSCAGFPCAKIDVLAKRYPNLISDGLRQTQIGLPRWLEEQEVRGQTGACYADFRHPSE